MGDKDDSITDTILRWGKRKRARIQADSQMSFRKYSAKILLSLAFIFLDGIFIPSGFEALGLLTLSYAVPIAVVLLLVVALELKVLSLIK